MIMDGSFLVLVADGNDTNRLVLIRALSKAGYRTLETGDGQAAIELARRQQPDLIILDLLIPECDGFDTCRHIKRDAELATIPVIFVTARSNPAEVVKAFSVGGSDYIIKPFQISEVLARVSVHVRLRRAEQQLRTKRREAEELASKLAEANVELSKLSRLDGLTGLLNRGAWEESAMLEQDRANRNGRVYSAIMIDVDHFKAFNDTLGHQAGDDCLREVAKRIRQALRGIDLVGRYGGEEFVVLAPETAVAAAAQVAERVRKAVFDLNVAHPESQCADRVTVSVGVADSTGRDWEQTLKLADDALYQAKREGRNRVVVNGCPQEAPTPKTVCSGR